MNNKFWYVVGASILMVGFQNCTKTNFSSANGGSSYLAALSGDTTPGAGNVGTGTTSPGTEPPSVTPPTSPTPHVCVAMGEQTSSSYSSHHASTSCALMHGGQNPQIGDDDSECDQDQDSEYVACIIQDAGNSLKLGLVQNSLDGVTSVAQSVCVTKSECLGDVAKHFSVVGAYERGYCEHNPNVTRLTDAQVKTLLGI